MAHSLNTHIWSTSYILDMVLATGLQAQSAVILALRSLGLVSIRKRNRELGCKVRCFTIVNPRVTQQHRGQAPHLILEAQETF